MILYNTGNDQYKTIYLDYPINVSSHPYMSRKQLKVDYISVPGGNTRRLSIVPEQLTIVVYNEYVKEEDRQAM